MFSTIYSALSGMLGFSKGLDVISNNIANLNTPGFKASELEFRDLFYRYSQDGGAPDGSRSQVGSGLDTKGTRTRFRQGELRDSGNPLDVAIDGNGFLVLQPKDGGVLYGRGVSQLYTRAGQLEFGTDGILVERVTGARVMVYDGAGMRELSIDSLRVSAPVPTANIRVAGDLLAGNITTQLNNVTVFDQVGRSRTLSIHFARPNTNTSDSTRWTTEVRDENGTSIGTGEVRFQPDGSPAAGANSFSFALPSASGPSTISVNIGEPGTFSGVVANLSGPGSQNTLQMRSQDGFAAGSLTSATFDERGTLRLSYSNGKTTPGPSLALAWFDDLQALRLTSGSLFVNDGGQAPVIGTAREGIMGGIAAGRVELSNVELTEQFTDLIILQRGYQASSQVTSVANEMIQQLLDLDRKR
jgi:flagellar hook protein FlgE